MKNPFGRHARLLFLAVLFSLTTHIRAATVTGMVQRITGEANRATITFFPSNTPAVINGGFAQSASTSMRANSAGWASNNLLTGSYRFTVDQSTRDIGVVWIPDSTATYDLWSLITSTNVLFNSNITTFLTFVQTNGVDVGSGPRRKLNFIGGTNVVLNGTNNASSNSWDIRINASGTGGGGGSAPDIYSNNVSVATAPSAFGTTNGPGNVNFTWNVLSSRPTIHATLDPAVTNTVTTNVLALENAYVLGVSNIAVNASNALRSDLSSVIGYTLAVSNIAYIASNSLRTDLTAAIAYTLGVSNISFTASNALRSDLTSAIAYTLAVSNIAYTASNSLRTDLIASIAYTLSVSNIAYTASNYLFGIIGGSAGVTNTLVDRIASATAVGDTSLTVGQLAFPGNSKSGYLVVDAFTTNCELRRIASVSASTIGFNAPLVWPHAAAAKVIFASGDAYIWWWNPFANVTSDDTMTVWKATQEASAVQAGTINVWLEGGGATFGIKNGITLLHDARIRRLNLTAITGYASNGTNDWMVRFAQGERYAVKFSNNFVYPLGGWAAPTQGATDPTNITVTFYGTNLASPLVMGKAYFIADVDAQKTNWFKLSLDTNRVELTLTDAGAGTNFVYTEVDSLTRGFLEDVYIKGGNIAHNGLNGNMQQPAYWKKVRLNEMGSYGQAVHLDGQEFEVDKLQVGNCDVGLYLGGLKMTVKHLNIESWTNGVIVTGTQNKVDGYHFEGALGTLSKVFDCTGGSVPGGATPILFHASDGVVAASAGHSVVIFDLGNASSSASVYPELLYCSGFNLDNGDIGWRDNLRGQVVYVYASTGKSFNRIIGTIMAPHVPDNTGIDDSYSGLLLFGMNGRVWHVGSQYGTHPFVWGQFGTNDTADFLKVNDSTGARVFGLNGTELCVSNLNVTFFSSSIKLGQSSVPGYVWTATDSYGGGGWSSLTFPASVPTWTVVTQLNVGPVSPWPTTASFDGSTDYANRGADTTGSMDTNRSAVSVWFKPGVTNTERAILGSANVGEHVYIYIGTDDKVTIDAYTNSPAGLGMRIKSTVTIISLDWHHLAASWNAADASKYQLYIDGTNALATVITNNVIFDLTASDWTIGTRGDSLSKWNGCLMDLMWWPTNYNDWTTNIALVFTNSQAVDPGPLGTLVNGVQPAIYLRNWTGPNAGYGGAFTINGTLTDTCTNPPCRFDEMNVQLSNSLSRVVIRGTNQQPMFIVQHNTDTGTGAEIWLRDTNGTGLSRFWSSGGYLYPQPASSGEANVNGEISLTNATVMGLVYDKTGATNRLRSIRPGNGITLTNESTNIVAAVDTTVIARQSDVVTASNLFVKIQSGAANALTSTNETAVSSQTNQVAFRAQSSSGYGRSTNTVEVLGPVGETPPADTNLVYLGYGILTNPWPVLKLGATWSNANVTFAAVQVSVQDKGSAAASKLIDAGTNGGTTYTSKFSVDKNGNMTNSAAVAFGSTGQTTISASGNANLGAGTLIVQDDATVGARVFSTYPIRWSARAQMFSTAAGVVQFIPNVTTDVLTNQFGASITNASNGRWTEVGYDNIFSSSFIRTMANGQGIFHPNAFGVNTNQALIFTTNHTITVREDITHTNDSSVLIGPRSAQVTNWLTGSASLDFGSTAAGAVSDLNISVTGVTSNGCHVMLSVPWESASGGGSFSTFNSNDTVFVRFANQQTVGAIDPGPGTFSAFVIKVK